jgi:hypothetical protein
MFRLAAVVALASLLGACAENPFARPEAEPVSAPAPTPAPAPEVTAPTAPPAAVASAPAALDTVSEEEKQAARDTAAAAPSGGTLGEVTVALGDPSDPGLWVKSSLVTAERQGTVRTGGGEAIAVTLRPIGGGDGGAQISLSAMQALGLPLVGLHPVTLSGS